METIKKKIFGLHHELADALSMANKAQETSEANTTLAKELEVKQRDLMKAIANKENDYDKASEDLEKATKSIREKERLTEEAKVEARALTGSSSNLVFMRQRGYTGFSGRNLIRVRAKPQNSKFQFEYI